MNKNILLFLIGAGCILCPGWSSVAAGDMKAVVTADFKLFHSHFGQSPFPSKSVTVDPEGVHLFFTSATAKPEYAALYSFFKLGGDCEVSARYDWRPVPIPRAGYGVSCGIRIETKDKKHSVSLARGIIPGKGDVYLVSIGTRRADKHVDYTNEPPFETSAKNGRLILLRQKKEVICLAADEVAEPRELCRIPFTDAAVQRVLIFADPGKAAADLDVWITDFEIRADEMSHHMTKQETHSNWWGVIAGVALILGGATGFLVVRRVRTGRWSGMASVSG
jgi:hypothetical protein